MRQSECPTCGARPGSEEWAHGEGQMSERAKIVDWLRANKWDACAPDLAGLIERGAHYEETK